MNKASRIPCGTINENKPASDAGKKKKAKGIKKADPKVCLFAVRQ